MGYEINVSGKQDPTAYEVMRKLFKDTPEKELKKNINEPKKNLKSNEILRNMVFYIDEIPINGAEKRENSNGRPAIIVSSDEINKTSELVDIVFLTRKALEPSPFNVSLFCGTQATAICSRIYTVNKKYVGQFIRRLRNKEIQEIDEAIKRALDLKKLYNITG